MYSWLRESNKHFLNFGRNVCSLRNGKDVFRAFKSLLQLQKRLSYIFKVFVGVKSWTINHHVPCLHPMIVSCYSPSRSLSSFPVTLLLSELARTQNGLHDPIGCLRICTTPIGQHLKKNKKQRRRTLFCVSDDWVYEQDMSLSLLILCVLFSSDTVTEGLVYTEESRSMTAIRFHCMES